MQTGGYSNNLESATAQITMLSPVNAAWADNLLEVSTQLEVLACDEMCASAEDSQHVQCHKLPKLPAICHRELSICLEAYQLTDDGGQGATRLGVVVTVQPSMTSVTGVQSGPSLLSWSVASKPIGLPLAAIKKWKRPIHPADCAREFDLVA